MAGSRQQHSSPTLMRTLRETGAWLTGHFLLSSGLHSADYIQCALLLQYPHLARRYGEELAERLSARPDVVIAPALGGLVIGHEVAAALGARFMFTERIEGVHRLRRGFTLSPHESAVVIEDVITTGKSTREAIAVIVEAGATLLAVGALVARSRSPELPQAPVTLLTVEPAVYSPESCPLCAGGGAPPVKPGSNPQPSP